jgi:alcohol dehydrogenase, propanol-preferring
MEWLTYNGVNITGTAVGTYQQMSDFLRIADQKKIGIKTETVQLKDINTALTRLERGDVQGRFVIAF